MASYRKKHIKHKISKIKHPKGDKKSIFKNKWFWMFILFLIIVSSSLYYLFFYSEFQLKNIIVSGNSKVKENDLQDIVNRLADKKIIDFANIKVNSKSIFLIDKNIVKSDILKEIPDIESITINKKLPQTLTLNITERKPLGAFCPNSFATGSNIGCFSIDQAGVIFDPLLSIPDGSTIVRQAMDNGQIFAGEKVVAQNIISAIYKIQKNLKDNFQINLTEALITSPVRLNVNTNKNWKIYFDLTPSSDIDSQLSKLNLLLGGEIPADSMSNLQYIDLRPKDRAITCDNKTCGGQ